jgi:DNA-binding NtrC family response regulator
MKKRILLVDDDPAVRRLMARALGEEEFDVVALPSEAPQIKALLASGTDAAIMDLNLPEPRSQEILAALASDSGHAPVILIVARTRRVPLPALPARCMIAEKPLDVGRLLNLLRSFWETCAPPANNTSLSQQGEPAASFFPSPRVSPA